MNLKYIQERLNKRIRILLNQQKNKKIDFFVIGTQKGGTTALDRYLRQHPQIGMPSKKELHFFDRDKLFTGLVDYNHLTHYFDLTDPSKIYGEVTPSYLFWTPSIERIWRYNQKAKLIAILRNPIDRAQSQWNMEFERGLETNDFYTCILEEIKKIKTQSDQQDRLRSYVSRGLYSEQIKRVLQYFKSSQVLFIKYENFRQNQDLTLTEILDFLGVQPNRFAFSHTEAHQTNYHYRASEAEKKMLFNFYEQDIKQVEKVLGWDCSDWLS